MADPKTPRAAALRNQIDLLLTDISQMSAEELVAMGVEVHLLPPGPRPPKQWVGMNPLLNARGRVRPAPSAE